MTDGGHAKPKARRTAETGRASDLAARWGFTAAAWATIAIVVMIFVFIGREAAPFLRDPGFGELMKTTWRPQSFQQPMFGILPLIVGSVLVTVIATALAIPFGVVGAVYLAEVATPFEREIIKPFIELLAGIPSVVLGFFGLVVIVPIIQSLPGVDTGLNALSASLVLAFMAIPTILTISEDAIRNVPRAYKQASMALGGTKLQTIWRVTVPAALSGIVAAVMLGIGRVVGETMAVLMIAGSAANMTINPTDPVRTMTATIAAEMGEVSRQTPHYWALFCVGIVLLLTTFLLNYAALRVFKKYGSQGA